MPEKNDSPKSLKLTMKLPVEKKRNKKETMVRTAKTHTVALKKEESLPSSYPCAPDPP
jgi:hypothetical protein